MMDRRFIDIGRNTIISTLKTYPSTFSFWILGDFCTSLYFQFDAKSDKLSLNMPIDP